MDASIQHTAQHIISQAFVRLYNIETLSFHMGEEISSIDLNSINVSQAEITSAELLSNDVVLENRKVNKFFVTENDLNKYNLRKKEEIEGPIRIVEIEEFDISMCGGTHVDFTGEIGLIKVIKSERQKRELTRLSFVAGKRALKDYSSKSYLVSSLSEFLTTGEEEILEKVKKLDSESRALSKESRILKQSILELQAKIIFGEEKAKNPAGTFIERELNELCRDDFLAFAKVAAHSYDMPFFLSSSKDIFIIAFRLSKIPEEDFKSIKDKILSETRGKVWNLSNDTVAVICDQSFKEILRRIFIEHLS
jgi:alanyl-tRNA synthetase